MERVVPWAALVELVLPYAPEGKRVRPPFAVQTTLRIHFMRLWLTLIDPAMEEALHDTPLFALSNLWMVRRTLLVLDEQVRAKAANAV